MNKHPIIIVGSGRCGTTLLVAMLNASNKVYIPFETSFLIRAEAHFGNKKIIQTDYDLLAHLFIVTSEKNGWSMDHTTIVDGFIKYQPEDLPNAINAVCRTYLSEIGVQAPVVWGLKRPLMITNLDRVYSCFPNAKVIHVVRDGRDVYLSYKMLNEKSDLKFGPNGICTAALYWLAGLKMAEPFSDRFITVRYEDLISNPDVELKRLEIFTGIDGLVERGLSYKEMSAPTVVSDDAAQFIHKKVYRGVDASNAYKYKSKMSLVARFVFECLASPYLKKYGYEREFVWLTWFFGPMRFIATELSVAYNRLRYAKRDRKFYEMAKERASQNP